MSTGLHIAFLPAALEIQEKPPSPVGRAIVWTILAVFCAALVWATLGHVDIVSVAQGRIIPSGHSKVVQSLEIGTVMAIRIDEGQTVDAGDVLIELDPTSAVADVTRLRHERHLAKRELARMDALIGRARNTGGGADDPVLAYDDDLLSSQWKEFQDGLAVLRHEQDKQRAERRRALQQVAKLKALLPIVTRRAKNQQGLAEQKMLPEEQYLEAEQSRLETLHDLRAEQALVESLDAAIAEFDARVASTHSEFLRKAKEQKVDAERRQSNAEQELVKAQSRLQARTITAPVAGVVQQLAVHSVGAVVTPAQQLLTIVPRDESLEVEAALENKDIGFVELGQAAEVKVDTFPFTKYGTLAGRVTHLSGDAVRDDNNGLVYTMRVRMEESTMYVNGRKVQLSPGMTVTVESKTGQRRLIEYFLSPLLRYRDEAVRER